MRWFVRESIRVADPLQSDRQFVFPADNRHIRKRASKIGSKEPGTVSWLHKTLRADDVFYDIGANVGIYSVFAAARISRGRVYSFEPHAGNFEVLLRSICLNNMADRIAPLSVALDAQSGCIDFAYHELRAGSTGSQLATSPLAVAQDHAAVVELKSTQAIDSMLAAGQIEPATVIKIDVDGAELNILRGMERLLAARSVRSLQVEIDPPQNDAIRAWLDQQGYRAVQTHLSRAGQRFVDGGGAAATYPWNVIFEPVPT
jgi:FkbM family methyltransferase